MKRWGWRDEGEIGEDRMGCGRRGRGVTVVTMCLILELSCYADTFKRNRFITQFSASNFLKLASTVQYTFFFLY